MARPYTIALIDDDRAILDSTRLVIEGSGLRARTFETADAFLARYRTPHEFDCIVCDVMMPGSTGLALQGWLREHADPTPFVLITGHGQIDMAVQAMKTGAADFIEKPFDALDLVERLQRLSEKARNTQLEAEILTLSRKRLSLLTQRERQVLDRLVSGASSREISSALGIGVRTVETHRASVMGKMEAKSLVDLVRIMLRLNDKAGASAD